MATFLNVRDFDAGQVERGDFPEELGLAWTTVTLNDHAGNHIDAPFHFGPFVEGKPAKTIDQVPLEWCYGPGVRLDFRAYQGRDVTAADIERELDRIGVEFTPGMIPLLWTGTDEYIDNDEEYWPKQAGLSEDGLHFLLDKGAHLIGIDAYAMDVSHNTMQKDAANGQPRYFPLHFVGRAREHMHLEKLANLGALPRPHGFLFAAFPIKIRGGSAGWVRPVAMVPASHFETP